MQCEFNLQVQEKIWDQAEFEERGRERESKRQELATQWR